MIHDENGNVALVYYQPVPGLYGGYYFDVKHGISLSWVPEAVVNGLLAIRGGCCGSQRQVIFPANQEHVNVWSSGER